MLCTSTYALSCNLKIDDIKVFESSGFVILRLYNPDNTAARVTAINYLDSFGSLFRSYTLNKWAKPKVNTEIMHTTSSHLLNKSEKINVNCR